MNQPDYNAVKALMDLGLEQSVRQADARRLLREAGLARCGLLHRLGCWLLCQLGSLLMVVGQRLQQIGSSRPTSLKPVEALGPD